MRPRNPRREFAFVLNDVARLLRTYADQRARRLGITRAQWAVMARLEHAEGLKQSELGHAPFSPYRTRLVDRSRNGCRTARRPNTVRQTPAPHPLLALMDRLAELARHDGTV